MTVIKDGTGTSSLTKVDLENRLHTSTISIPESTHVSIHDQKTFTILGQTTIAASTEKTILILINNSNSSIGIDNILVSIQGESGKLVTLKAYIGKATITSGGTTVTPLNLNITSTAIIDVTVKQDNPTVGGTDSLALEIFLESTGAFATEFSGEIVLGKDASIRITATGDAAAAGTKIALSRIIYYEISTDIHT